VRVADPALSIAKVASETSSPVATNVEAREVEGRPSGGLTPILAASTSARDHSAIAIPTVYRSRRGSKQSTPSTSYEPKRVPYDGRNPELIRAYYAPSETAADGQMLVTVVETRFVTGGLAAGALWQVSVVEVRWIVPANHSKKETPRKT